MSSKIADRPGERNRDPASGTAAAATRILIADKLAPEGGAFLMRQPGVEVEARAGLAGPALGEVLRHFDGVVVRSGVQITAEVLRTCLEDPTARLRAVVRAGVGVDNIDLAEATRWGVAVMNSASASTITTAEHAFALMIALARNIGPAHMTMSQGGWDRGKFVGAQLHGRVLGVVGMGRIGRTLGERALAFGMTVVGYDPMVNVPAVLDGRVRMCSTFDELIEQVDIVSFHVPLNDRTAGMLSRAQFARARPGLLVINAARGGVVDEDALHEALEAGQCGGAALDVFPEEPPPADSPLRKHPKILCTPHLGASTVEAQEAVAVDACRVLLAYLKGEGLEGAVNAGGLQLDLTERQRAFADLAERMILLLHAATDARGMSEVTVSVRGERLAGRADAIGRLALAALLNRHLDQPVNVINAAMIAEERGITVQTRIAADHGEDRLAVEIGIGDERHRVEGAILSDGLPRITHLDGYGLDMVPSGHVVLLTNSDEPGRIGLVGKVFGDAGVNIAAMVIGRQRQGHVAMMIIKLDDAPPAPLIDSLRRAPGILGVASVTLG